MSEDKMVQDQATATHMKKFLRNNGLGLVLTFLFLALWSGQAITGFQQYNEERAERGTSAVGFGSYLASAHFLEATGENWESEFLQMSAYVFLTVFLFQKGSAESNDPDQIQSSSGESNHALVGKVPWPVRRGGWVLKLYEHSLGLAFATLFIVAGALHAIGGCMLRNEEEIEAGRAAISTWEYICTSRFWFEAFQNWQSEFLAIASMVVLSIWLRQRGSPESKPVNAPHEQTGG